METIFSTSNGYLGMRGSFEEGEPVFENGTYINGFHETWPIPYGEEAHGFAKEGQTIINVPDCKIIRLFVDDEPFSLTTARLLKFERTLDFRSGTLDREIIWEMASGKRVAIKSRRLVSYEQRHIAAISYEVTLLNAAAPLVISSETRLDPRHHARQDDPRLHQNLRGRPLHPRLNRHNDARIMLGYQTARSKLALLCAADHKVETAVSFTTESESSEEAAKVTFSFNAQPDALIRLVKFMTYHTSGSLSFDELVAAAERSLKRVISGGFQELLAGQRRYLDDFWSRTDVQIEGNPACDSRARELQQALRFNLFQIHQASVRVEENGIPAKGLTGQAYDGNYFWDTEMYLLPCLIYTAPQIARNILRFRYRMLDKARERAREVGEQGALFPWRTINGEEASSNYAAGTAQYHINADIMYGLQKYVEVTGDDAFLAEAGAEMLVETARMWRNLGFFSDRKAGAFCIHGVTGPDEYTTVVNNNVYTNLMAQNNLSHAAEVIEALRANRPKEFSAVAEKTGLDYPTEVREWQRAAEQMFIPIDDQLKICPQDDSFLDKKVWDFEHTPSDQYPLLLHFHPLKIYRHQVIKQADVVLAMFLLEDRFPREHLRSNFDYYDPLTTGDSSLSVCIQGIVAARLGYLDKALDYARYAVLMDLEDVEENVQDGCHIASMGGSWMLCVYGFAGMRDLGGRLSFDPRLPRAFKRLRFPLTIRAQTVEVIIEPDVFTFHLQKGSGLSVWCQGKEIRLAPGTPVAVKASAPLDD